MNRHDSAESAVAGGSIPGLAPRPAFTLHGADTSTIPVLLAVPHGGRAYPAEVIAGLRDPDYAAMRLEDRYTDLLAGEIARRTAAVLLVAHAPRAMLDLNRAPEDIDWEMFAGPARGIPAAPGAGRRARSGLGLFPRRLPGFGELWKRRLDAATIEERIATIHRPYHEALGAALARIRARWGAALLLDLHSMPPLAPLHPGAPVAEFVVGDRFGASCDGSVTAAAFGFFAEAGRRASHNRPYAGGYVLERHAATRHGVHALQLEVDRRSYLDERLADIGPGYAETVELLAALVRRLAEETALLGHSPRSEPWAVAAE